MKSKPLVTLLSFSFALLLVGLCGYLDMAMPQLAPPRNTTATLNQYGAAMTVKEALRFAGIELNTATAQQLQGIRGIGPVLAARIIEHRQTIGDFTDIAQLKEVKGIGDKLLLVLEQRCYVVP